MIRSVLVTILAIGGILSGRAQPSERGRAAVVEVARVQSGTVRDGAGAAWYQIEINLRVKGSGSGRERYASGVGITLNLATETKEALSGLEFYRAAVTAVALESGQHVVRFYLPPELVARDRLQGDLRFWVIDLSLQGQEIPKNRSQVGEGFSSPVALENFRKQLAREAGRNDGVLLPQHLTPFGDFDSANLGPTMTRAEATQSNR